MAKKCDIFSGEEKWIREIFLNNMKTTKSSGNFWLKLFLPRSPKGLLSWRESNFISSYLIISNAVRNHQTFNKLEATLAVDRGNSCMKSGGKFTKRQIAICPVKETICTTCDFIRNFTKNCKFRRRNINIVNSYASLHTKM